MHIGILQSPWLCELMAFHINLRETKTMSRKAPALFEGCSLKINDGKPSLACELFDSVKLDVDLTCSICLVSFKIFYFSQDVLHICHSFLTAYFCCSAQNCTSFNSVYGFNYNIRGFKNWAWNIKAHSKYYSYSLKLKISAMPHCYELGAHMASF